MDVFEKNILELGRQLSLKNLRFFNEAGLRKYRPDVIAAIGMGGSGTVGLVLKKISKDVSIQIPVIAWNDYGLPPEIEGGCFKRPLLVFVSFSGNTEETLDGFAKAARYGRRAVVTGGGKLMEAAKKSGDPLAVFEKYDLAPRQANGVMLYGALGLLKNSLPKIKIASPSVNPAKYRELGKKISAAIGKKNVVVYTTTANSHLGYLWKAHLNETGKVAAFSNVIPEMNHNEIVAFETKPKNFIACLIKGGGENSNERHRLNITEKVLSRFGVPTIVISPSGKTAIEKTFNLVSLAQWTAYFTAKARGISPLETKSIDLIKKLI